jgi:DNA-directed RNA polymerase specialized sigma24 family protein
MALRGDRYAAEELLRHRHSALHRVAQALVRSFADRGMEADDLMQGKGRSNQ